MIIRENYLEHQRAEAIVSVFFTRFENLEIIKEHRSRDLSYDLLVNLKSHNRIDFTFAVEIKSTHNISSRFFILQEKHHLVNLSKRSEYPLMLTLVDIIKKDIYYSWLKPPSQIQDAQNIALDSKILLKKLTKTEFINVIQIL
jgi:hypothetical protein